VLPGNNEEKYVVKRLLRRAVLDGRQMGMREPFLHKLPPVVAAMMRKPYPELGDTTDRVGSVIEREEASFLATIDGGLDRIERLFKHLGSSGKAVVAGGDAAELYTTYGFPPELLETLAAERNCGFDWDGFRKAMDEHGLKSGAGTRVEVFTSGPLDALKKTMHGSEFLGYDAIEAPGKVIGIIAQDSLCDRIQEVGHAQPVTIVLDRTPFYGESGGQVGDTGRLTWPGGEFEVADTLREGGFMLHVGHLRRGVLDLGATVTAAVDPERRAALRRAHSATHLLHAALQHHLGAHAVQQGSKVDADLLRFDFSHTSAIDHDTLAAIEAMVNAGVLSAVPVTARLLPLAEARHAGAMMLFGEKYPDVVRMVSMEGVSRELCGGTHVTSTGQIGLVRIVGEESVSAGTRRIAAVTGAKALDRFRQAERTLAEAATALKVPVGELPHRLAAVVKELRDLKKAKPAAAGAALSADDLLAAASSIAGTRIVVADAKGGDAGAMRQCIDLLRRKGSPIAVLLGSVEGDKVTLVAGISRELEEKGLSAGNWIKDAATVVGGKGGGRPDLAQAGGKLVDKLPEALAAARQSIEKLLG
jgi:alanyl-tRNA synthetase